MSRSARVLEGLKRASAEGRLHHAYMLTGPESPAKLECARKLAASFAAGGLLGPDEAGAFERIQRGNHPDFLLLKEAEGGQIGVDEVRTLPKALAYPPLESSRRVVVIEGGMNVQAANALLKILEEPPGHTMFFLLGREPSDFLPTIVSRCQVVRFAPLAGGELLEALGDRAGAAAGTVAAWSDGSLARAESLLAEGALGLAGDAADMILQLWEASPRIPSSVFQWAEKVEADEECNLVLDTWELMLRDLSFVAVAGEAPGAVFPELLPRLKGLMPGEDSEVAAEISAKSAAINRFRVYRRLNGNLRLDFAALLTELQVFSVGKARSRE